MSKYTRLQLAKRVAWVCFYVVPAISVTWLALTRWNATPADASGVGVRQEPSGIPIDPKDDRTAELLAAFNALPPEPMWTLPPAPKGMRWTGTPRGPIEPSDITYGDWTPDTRPHMQAVIRHLESPAVRKAVAQFAAIETGGCRISSLYARDLRRAAKLLLARVRYDHAGLDNVDAAIDDLLTIYRFAATCCNSGIDIKLNLYLTPVHKYGSC